MLRQALVCITLISLILMSGCINRNQSDIILERAEPYIAKIDFNNIEMRAYANSVIRNCSSSDEECQINAIYRHVVENFNYVSDPLDEEFIQSPNETLLVRGGDCEDLSILLISLLENIGFKTYLFLTQDHFMASVANVNTSDLWSHIKKSLTRQVEEEWGKSDRDFNETFDIMGWGLWFYPVLNGSGSNFTDKVFDYVNITYKLQSAQPINFYVVPSKNEYESHKNNNAFDFYARYRKLHKREIQGVCTLHEDGGIMIDNYNSESTTIDLDLTFYFHPCFDVIFKNKNITSYEINNQTCIVLDPTEGIYGFPGYCSSLQDEITVIDPVQKEYFKIKN